MTRGKQRKNQPEKTEPKRDAFDLYYNGRKTITELAARFNTSERTIFRWIAAGKEDKPADAPAPKRTRQRPKQYPDAIFERIKVLKTEQSRRTATNIHGKLKAEFQDECPSIHLVRKYMAREGLNVKDPAGRKGYVKFSRNHSNEMWQIDIAGVQHIPGLGDVYLIATLDDCSRVCTAGTYFLDQRGVNIVPIIRDAVEEYGRPNQLLSDNGAQFKNLVGDLGTRYSKLLETLDIEPIFSRPHHPQTKGKLERFFRTVKSSFLVDEKVWFEQHPGATIHDLNKHFREWLAWYNNEKPHRSLPGNCTPAKQYTSDPDRVHRPLATIFDWDRWLQSITSRKVTKYNTVSYKRETIQLPPGYMGCRVDVIERENVIEVHYKSKCIVTHEINRDFARIRNKAFLRKINQQGYVKYKNVDYRVDPVLAGKHVTIKETNNGAKIVIYIENTFFCEYTKKIMKKKGKCTNA